MMKTIFVHISPIHGQYVFYFRFLLKKKNNVFVNYIFLVSIVDNVHVILKKIMAPVNRPGPGTHNYN